MVASEGVTCDSIVLILATRLMVTSHVVLDIDPYIFENLISCLLLIVSNSPTALNHGPRLLARNGYL